MLVAVFSLLIIIAITMLITRLVAMALVLTGMSQESAQFQARSALAGVGFTTREAESVVMHPARRRIIMLLMLTGSISVPTVIATLGVSLFTAFQADDWWFPLLLLLSGLFALILSKRNRWLNKHVNAVLAWGLKNWTDLDVRDYGSLLQLQNGFAVTELLVKQDDWLAQKTLQKAALSHEGVLVLGIQRPDGAYLGTPRATDTIQAGDTLVLYGQIDLLKKLDQRHAASGDSEHEEATVQHIVESAKRDIPDLNASEPPPPEA